MTLELNASFAPADTVDFDEAAPRVDPAGASMTAVVATLSGNDRLKWTEAAAEADDQAPLSLFKTTTFSECEAVAAGEVERLFVRDLKLMAEEKVPVPWGVYGPCFKSVVAYLDMEPAEVYEHPGLPLILQQLSAHLTRATGRMGTTLKPAKLHELSFIQAFRRKARSFPYGTALPRYGNRPHVSWDGLEEMFGFARGSTRGNADVKKEISAGLRSGRYVLGAPYRDRSTLGAARKVAVQKMLDYFKMRMDCPSRRPIEIGGLTRRRYKRELYFEEAGIQGVNMREALWRDPRIRRALKAAVDKLGTANVADLRAKEVKLAFSVLLEMGRDAAEEAFRERHPDAAPEQCKRAGSNEHGYLLRAMRENDWAPMDDAVDPLLGPDAQDAINRGLTESVAGNDLYLKAMTRFVSLAERTVEAQKGRLTFAGRLMAGIKRKRLALAEFARRLCMPPDTLHRWVSGKATPTFMQAHFVLAAERELGLPKNDLLNMLGELRTGRNRTGRTEITLSDGRSVQLKRYLRYLPHGAVGWEETKLRDAVERVDERQYGNKTANVVRQKAVSELSRSSEELDPSMPIWQEWNDIVVFKTRLNDNERHISPKWEWSSSATVANNYNHLKGFVRWLVMPKDQGGLGLRSEQVGMYLILNHQIVQKYVFYRTLRWSCLTVDGKELGAMLGGTELGFVGFVKAMLHSDYGWLPQSRNIMMPPQVITDTFELEEMVKLDGVFSVRMPQRPMLCQVMSAQIVQRAAVDWTGMALSARRFVATFYAKIEKTYEMIRNPHDLIMPILIHDHPLAVVVRQIAEALKRVRPIEVSPMEHAKDFRNAVAMLLLVTVVFRSDTLRNMEYRADGSGNLIRTPNGYDVVVEHRRFKNGFAKWLFGPSFRRHDYERALGDWRNLNEVLDYYLKTCRPILLKGRESDLLFPTGQSAKKWSESTFNTMITNWTRTWSVVNERYGTGLPGVLPWGPHAMREIVATHIIRNFEGEERWERAAIILGSGVEVVKAHYAYVDRRREHAKLDGMYEEVFAMGFGDAAL